MSLSEFKPDYAIMLSLPAPIPQKVAVDSVAYRYSRHHERLEPGQRQRRPIEPRLAGFQQIFRFG
jgi:hypothetical protein